MTEKHIKSKIQMNQKHSRKFTGILRRLAQSENLLNNKLKVIISEGEIIEENNHIFIIPSKFKEYSENSVDQNSTEKASEKTIENSNIKENFLSPHIEKMDYPDSSDFSEDE